MIVSYLLKLQGLLIILLSESEFSEFENYPDLCSTDFIGGYSHLTPSGFDKLRKFLTPKG